MSHRFFILLLLVVTIGLAGWGISSVSFDVEHRVSPQSANNLRFTRYPEYASAFKRYTPVWPPAYPSLLWVAQQAGSKPMGTNVLLFLTSLGLMYQLARKGLSVGFSIGATGLFATSYASFINLRESVSEHLVIPLAAGVLLGLCHYVKYPRKRVLVGVTLLMAVLSITRYFGFIWMAGVVALVLICQHVRSPKVFCLRSIPVAFFSLLPIVGWSLFLKRLTGYYTAMDRVGPRRLAAVREYWNESTHFLGNVKALVKTLYLDGFDFERHASHAYVDNFTRHTWDVGLILFLAFLLGGTVWMLRKEIRRGLTAFNLLTVAVGFYLVGLVFIWTWSNNDPIYTRFVYPLYPFGLLWLVAVGHLLTLNQNARFIRWGWMGVGVIYVASQWVRIVNY